MGTGTGRTRGGLHAQWVACDTGSHRSTGRDGVRRVEGDRFIYYMIGSTFWCRVLGILHNR